MALIATGCIFTEPINRAPNARITVESAGPYNLDSLIRVSARKSSDPDGDELSIRWLVIDDDGASDAGGSDPFEFQPPAKGSIRVVLEVEDDHRAKSQDDVVFDIVNRQPEIELQAQGPRLRDGTYLVGRELRVVAEAWDLDGDELDLDWRYSPPRDSDPNEVEFEEADDTSWRLLPDVAGAWEVEVEASDGDGGVATATRAFHVSENTPPCIAATDPPAPGGGAYVLGVDEPPRRFTVLAVDDELDAYPARAGDPDAGEASFRWLLSSPDSGGEFVEVSGRDAPDFIVDPGEHAPGDELAVRVEVTDRIERDIACGDDRLTCSIGDNDCVQRTTWEVEIR